MDFPRVGMRHQVDERLYSPLSLRGVASATGTANVNTTWQSPNVMYTAAPSHSTYASASSVLR